MSRIKLSLPHFNFVTEIPVRISDINYGGHLGNDSILSIMHEARLRFLTSAGSSELKFGGLGLIMADVAIEFKSEAFYGEVLKVFVAATEFSNVSFNLYYKIVKAESDNEEIIALGKTGMVCYDYENKKVSRIPEEEKQKLLASS